MSKDNELLSKLVRALKELVMHNYKESILRYQLQELILKDIDERLIKLEGVK